MINFEYADLLGGQPIFIEGIGSAKSPKLKELLPSSGIGFWAYRFYIGFLMWGRDDLFKYLEIIKYPHINILKNDKLSLFDIITLAEPARDILIGILSLFFVEEPEWNDRKRSFFMREMTEDGSEPRYIGVINRDNYDVVKDIILKLNYIGLDSKPKEIKHSSETARILWEKAQEYQARYKNNDESDEKTASRYNIGNVISKLCIASSTYNLLNVYELTVFQLYDQYFQCDFIRARDLERNVFSYHGGDNFDLQQWQDPIISLKQESGKQISD